MKKLLILLIFLFYFTATAYPQNDSLITMRINKKNDSLRIILESSLESQILLAKIYTSYTLVKIAFPAHFLFKKQSTSESIDVTQKGKTLYFNIHDLENIEVVKLTSPSRLILDTTLKSRGKTQIKVSSENEFTDVKYKLNSLMLDAGHGGYDTGIRGSNYKESLLAMSITRAIDKQLEKKDKKVYYTRNSDTYASINDRISEFIKHRPDFFISFHISYSNHFTIYTCNVPAYESVYEIRYNTRFTQTRHLRKSKAAARSVGGFLEREFNFYVIYREIPLPLLLAINAPAILIELPGPEFFSYNSNTLQRLALEIITGIEKYEEK